MSIRRAACLAAALGLAASLAPGAAEARGWHGGGFGVYLGPPAYYAPPPYYGGYWAPPAYYPPPVYYAPPPPAYYAPPVVTYPQPHYIVPPQDQVAPAPAPVPPIASRRPR
ncbi:hypothetical protein ACFQS7_00235 [Dankookia sp. GCM10030260]|uniref:hypothetical protein n=1 Tax=Dankookia sp. GCM10030260 TaxID=3273390 RepID=UPI00360917BE